jgi:hypothetical protein
VARGSAASRRRLCTVLAVLGAAVALPGAAQASLSCADGTTKRPFLPWLDPLAYVLAPGGAFESDSTSWRFANGARIVAGNEPYKANAASDTRSLYLPSGSSATTPYVCVGLLDPTVRFFAKNRGSVLGVVKVDALVRTPLGIVTLPVGAAAGLGVWAPSLPLPLLANALAPLDLDDGTAEVAFRFKPSGLLAAWQIDDVYVDPFRVR